jgi:N-acetyl sugar amidotransferase
MNDMERCARCLLPITYETLEIGHDGVCNICRAHERKEADDWDAKKKDLDALIEQYRGRHDYDCIIPFSGGKDSTFALWYLVTNYKIKPLVVRYDHGFMRDGVNKNMERTIKRLGVDSLSFTANWKLVKRTMLEALIRKSDFCWSCHVGVFSFPMHIALKFQVPLIFWGERSSDYTSYFGYDEEENVDETRFNRFINLGITADDIAGMIKHDFDFDYRDLKPFQYPPRSELQKLGVRSVCLGSFIKWDVREQVKIIEQELGWKGDAVEGMPSGRWTYDKVECAMQGVRDYLKFLKRGYSRVSQNGRMTTEEARAVIAANEGRRPPSLDIFLDYVGISEAEFNTIVAQHAIYPHEPDFNLPDAEPTHDRDSWYRECSKSV